MKIFKFFTRYRVNRTAIPPGPRFGYFEIIGVIKDFEWIEPLNLICYLTNDELKKESLSYRRKNGQLMTKPFVGQTVEFESYKYAKQNVIQPDETLMGMVKGYYLNMKGDIQGGSLSPDHHLIVTDKRVHIWTKSLMGSNTLSVFYNNISSVQGERGVIMGDIYLNIRGTKERFGYVPKAEVDPIVEIIRKNMDNNRLTSQQTHISIPDQIRKLSELKEAGILTEDEFNQKKQELLARM